MTREEQHQEIDIFKGKVSLTDLHLEFFEDNELAEDLAEECLQLFKTTEQDFSKVRNQKWYKRLWGTLSGGNTRRLAQGCATLAQAQQLLLKVLQTHAQTNARSQTLMMYVARGLKHVEGQQNRVVAAIVHMADRVVLLEEEVALHRKQLNTDPANEITWNQEHKLLLYKLLAICANSDGEVASQEQEILEHKRHNLELRDEYLEEAKTFLDNPQSIDDELKRIDSYRKCLNMYRHALGMFYADGKIKPQERAGIEQLAKILHIRPDDKESVKASFARLHGGFSQAQLLSLMSNKKKRTAREPEPKEFEKIDQERASMKAREKSQKQTVRKITGEIEEIGPAWAEQISEFISEMIVFPLNERFEKYGSSKDSELDELVESLDVESLSKEIDDNLNATFEGLEEVINDVYAHIALPPRVHKELESTWQRCINDDGGWNSALDELQSAGEDLLDSESSGAWNLMKGGSHWLCWRCSLWANRPSRSRGCFIF